MGAEAGAVRGPETEPFRRPAPGAASAGGILLTFSVFRGTLAHALIDGTFAGTILTLVFLPAMYAIWFRIKPPVMG